MVPPPREPSTIRWRFGDRVEDVDAWLRSHGELHIMVEFQSPDTPGAQWHSIMTVTHSWVRNRAGETARGAVWPALLIVPDGTRAEIEHAITDQLQISWSLVARYAELLDSDDAG